MGLGSEKLRIDPEAIQASLRWEEKKQRIVDQIDNLEIKLGMKTESIKSGHRIGNINPEAQGILEYPISSTKRRNRACQYLTLCKKVGRQPDFELL